MDDLKAVMEKVLGEIAGELEAAGERLGVAHASLPVSPREDVMLAGEEEPDFSCRVRAAIECALRDHLEPLIASLRALTDKAGEA